MAHTLPTRATLLASFVALLLLAGVATFVGLASDDDGGGGGGDQASPAASLPEGFVEIPGDVFVDRIFGAQRAAGSWHVEKVTQAAGVPREASLDTEVHGSGIDISGTVNYPHDEANPTPVEVRVIDGVYYATGLGSAKKWWQIDPTASDTAQAAQDALSALSDQTTSERLQDAVAEVELVGKDLVEGVTVAHYRVTLTLPGDETQVATLDAWVDADDRPVKLVTTAELEGTTVTSTSVYSAYGEDFDIQAPPPSETTTEIPAVGSSE